MSGGIEDDERTNPVGLFNTARSYWRSAEHLDAAQVKVTHREAPVTFLLCHAIELYLKAFLRGAGRNVAQLKKIGHRVADLAQEAVAAGLKIADEPLEILCHLDKADIAIEARYIVTGFKNTPTNEALSSVATNLDQVVGAVLAKKGFAIRQGIFRKPAVRTEIQESVEEYIPFMTKKDKEIIAYLLHNNQRMFTAESDGGHARLLLSKGIVRIAARPGQHLSLDDVPFEVPIEVWRVLEKHKSKFLYLQKKDAPHPWRVHWMER